MDSVRRRQLQGALPHEGPPGLPAPRQDCRHGVRGFSQGSHFILSLCLSSLIDRALNYTAMCKFSKVYCIFAKKLQNSSRMFSILLNLSLLHKK